MIRLKVAKLWAEQFSLYGPMIKRAQAGKHMSKLQNDMYRDSTISWYQLDLAMLLDFTFFWMDKL